MKIGDTKVVDGFILLAVDDEDCMCINCHLDSGFCDDEGQAYNLDMLCAHVGCKANSNISFKIVGVAE